MWLAIILTINKGIGLISLPVGLNLSVINGPTADFKLKRLLTLNSSASCRRVTLCRLHMVTAMVLLYLFPGLALGLPDLMMGPVL